jgi:DNA-binding transcriptional LysR family regulator
VEGFRRRIPSLTSLVVLEAAARHLNFSKAARELGVTQAAVSRQIHGLEQELGLALFHRLHRGVELTERGQVLSGVLAHSFDLIARTTANLRTQSEADELVIGATLAFTQLWLLPRISEFRWSRPDTNIRLVSQDTPIDLEYDLVDVVIRYGDGIWADGRSVFLCEDDIFPVCSPIYAAARPLPKTVDELVDHALLDRAESANPGWIGWKEWLAAFSTARPSRVAMCLSYYTDVIHAALAGHGIALGWNCLVEDLLQQGRLVRVTDAQLHTHSAYFVVVPSRNALKPSAEAFVEWLGLRLKSRAA